MQHSPPRQPLPLRTLWVKLALAFVALYLGNLALFGLTGGFGKMAGPGWDADEVAQNQMLVVFLGLPVLIPALLFLAASAVTTWTGRSGFWVVSLGILVLIGGVALGSAVLTFAEGLRSLSYLSTKAKIVTSQIQTQEARTRDDRRERLVVARGVREFFLVEYEYQVGGQRFLGDDFEVDTEPMESEEVEALVARYPQGASVPVYYHPQNPANSVLKPGVPRWWFLPLGLSALVWLAAWGLWSLPQVKRAVRETK